LHLLNGYDIPRLSYKYQIIILLAVLASLITSTFIPYGFPSFLKSLDTGHPIALGLLISIIATAFFLLHKLGFEISYKEEFETIDSKSS